MITFRDDRKNHAIKFKDVPPGTIFAFTGAYFFKLDKSNYFSFVGQEANAVWFSSNPGTLCNFGGTDEVELMECAEVKFI